MNTPEQAARPAKKPYAPPRLTVHGGVEELTQGPRNHARVSDAPCMGTHRLIETFVCGS